MVCSLLVAAPVVNQKVQEQEQPTQYPQQAISVQPVDYLSQQYIDSDADQHLKQLADRHSPWTVLPRVDLQPGFTRDPRASFTLDLGAVGLKQIIVRGFTLNGTDLKPASWDIQGTMLTLTLTLGEPLKVGLNTIKFEYVHPDKPGGADKPITFTYYVNHQPNPTPVMYGEQGELIVDGKPIFAVGSFRSGQTDTFIEALPSAKAAGVSWVHDYGFENMRGLKEQGLENWFKQLKAYLRKADELGLGVAVGLPRPAVKYADEPMLARYIGELSGEPALWFWYLYDEPMERTMPVLSMARTYYLVKRLDPNHPVVTVFHREESTAVYHPFTDAVWSDKYPISATGQEMISLTSIYADVRRIQELVGNKPVNSILQLHDNRSLPWLRKKNPDWPKPSDKDHRPTADEVRAQAHVALAAGVRAIGYYWGPEFWYSMKKDTPGHWANFTQIVHDLRALEPIILADEPAFEVRLKQPPGQKTLCWSRLYEGKLYIGIVNPQVYEARSVRLPELTAQAGHWAVHAAYVDSTVTASGDVRLGPAGVLIAVTDLGESAGTVEVTHGVQR